MTHLAETYRSRSQGVLLVDAGGFFPVTGHHPHLRATLALSAMDMMGYDAVNVGINEFMLGDDFFRQARAGKEIPLVTSNLVHADTGLPYARKYVVKDAGGIRVAFLGILPEGELESLPNPKRFSHLRVLPPLEALKVLLPEIKEEGAHVVVLLSQCGAAATIDLVNALEGIHVAVAGEVRRPRALNSSQTGPAPCARKAQDALACTAAPHTALMVKPPLGGSHLGVLELFMNDLKAIARHKKRLVRLGDSQKEDPRVARLLEAFQKVEGMEREQMLEQRKAAQKKLLEMSPEEYLNMINNSKIEQGEHE